MDPEALLSQETSLRGLARSLVFGDEEVDDVVQETFVAALEHPPRDEGRRAGFLAVVLRNALRRHRRGAARWRHREEVAAAPAPVPTPAEIREREETRRRVVEAVLALDPAFRDVVVLRFFEDLPPRTIAARLEAPVETVKTRLKRALARLRERLDREHGGDRRAWALPLAGLLARRTGGVVGAGAGAGAGATTGIFAAKAVLSVLLFLAIAAAGTLTLLTLGPALSLGPAPAAARSGLPPLPTGPLAIRGTVRDPDGRPLPGVPVRLSARRGTGTDAAGRFVFVDLPRETAYEVRAGRRPRPDTGDPEPTVATVAFAPDETEKEVDLVVTPPGEVLLLVAVHVPGGVHREVRAQLRRPGRAVGDEFPPGADLLLLGVDPLAGERADLSVWTDGCYPSKREIEVPAEPGIHRVDVSLEVALFDWGLVVDEDGDPVPDARVHWAEHPLQPGYGDDLDVDSQGRFAIRSSFYGKYLMATGPGPTVSDWVRLDRDLGGLVLRLGEGGHAEGRVLDPERGAPVADATVVLGIGDLDASTLDRSTVTGEDGRWRFDAVPVGTLLRPRVADSWRALGRDEVDSWELIRAAYEPSAREKLEESGVLAVLSSIGETYRRDLSGIRLHGVSLTVRLRFPSGTEPPERLTVHQGWIHSGGWRSTTREAPFDPTRPFREVFLPEGRATLSFTAPGFFGRLPPFEIEGDGPPETAEVTMARRRAIVARVLDEDGKPVARKGLMVWAQVRRGASGHGAGGKTGPDGTVDLTESLPSPDLSALADARILFWVDDAGGFDFDSDCPQRVLSAQEYVDLSLGTGGPAYVDLVVRKTWPLSFRVVDEEGDPIAGAVIDGVPPEAFGRASATSDDEGRLTIPLLEADRGELIARTPWCGRIEVSRLIGGFRISGTTDWPVEPGEEIVLRCRDELGRLVANTPLYVNSFPVRTDAAGTVEVSVPAKLRWVRVAGGGYLAGGVKPAPGQRSFDVVLTRCRSVALRVRVPEPTGSSAFDVRYGESLEGATSGRIEGGEGLVKLKLPLVEVPVQVWTGDGLSRGAGTAAEGVEALTIDLLPVPRHEVVFRLCDIDGRPVADRPLDLKFILADDPCWFQREGLVSGSDGTVQVPLPDGRYDWFSASFGPTSSVKGAGFDVPAREHVVVEVPPLPAPTVTVGVLLDGRETGVFPDASKLSVTAILPGGEQVKPRWSVQRGTSRTLLLGFDVPDVDFTLRIRYGDEETTWSRGSKDPPVIEVK